MRKRILVVCGHPDLNPDRFCRALAASYADGAISAGHAVDHVDIAQFQPCPTGPQQDRIVATETLGRAAYAMSDAQHLLLVFPLWLGAMPALLESFLEQATRAPSVAGRGNAWAAGGDGLQPRSARLVATMGAPAPFRRFRDYAHGLDGMSRDVVRFVGANPVRHTLLGAEGLDRQQRAIWLRKMRRLGARAA
jgi:putative NADPH-quinone reductase